MTDGHLQRDGNSESVEQVTSNGTRVQVIRIDRDRDDGLYDYYHVRATLANGTEYTKEISVDDVRAWNSVEAGRIAMREAFVAEHTSNSLADGWARFTNGGIDALFNGEAEFSPAEAEVLVQYAIRAGTQISSGVVQPPGVQEDAEAPLRAGPIGGQARAPETDATTPPRR